MRLPSRRRYNSVTGNLRRLTKKKKILFPYKHITPKALYDLSKKSQPDLCLCRGEVKGIVYGLFASNEPERICYVGATMNSPQHRLHGHKLGRNSKKVFEWIKNVMSKGHDIGIEVFQDYPIEELSAAEAAWTLYFTNDCHEPLLNNGIRSSHLRKIYSYPLDI